MFYIIVFLYFITLVNCEKSISIYGDVYKDREFFTKTFPWLVDNIGGDISVSYFLLGSGRYSIPQMCALSQLDSNVYLQAQYLKCEAEGHDSQKCFCDAGANPTLYKNCVLRGGYLTSIVFTKYTKLQIDITPIIDAGNGVIYNTEQSWYLKRICESFDALTPRGCLHPTTNTNEKIIPIKMSCNCFKCHNSTETDTEGVHNKKALSTYDANTPNFRADNLSDKSVATAN